MYRLSSTVILIGIALMCAVAEEEKYSDRYDDIDVKSILNNNKLRQSYVNCLLEKGPCRTADAKFYKEIFAEAIITKCKKCTEKQRKMLDDIADWYAENNPEEWTIIIDGSISLWKKKNDH